MSIDKLVDFQSKLPVEHKNFAGWHCNLQEWWECVFHAVWRRRVYKAQCTF